MFDQRIDRSATESIKWHHFPPDVLPMWVADMDFRSPEAVARALQERVAHGVFGYGTEPPELRGVLVERLEQLYGWHVAPESIVFLPGVVVGFNLACRMVAEPGVDVLVQPPVYFPMLHAPAHFGLRRRDAPLVYQPDGSYDIDMQAFDAAIGPATRLFMLCNPHNPVGRVFRRDELAQLAEICLQHDLLICSDEIHCDLVFSESRHIPIASLDPEIARRSITLMAPSKTFNIAGLHCAFAVIPDSDLRQRYQQSRAGLVGGPSILDYTAAIAAYRDGEPWLRDVLAYLESNRDYLVNYVNNHLPGVRMWRPQGAYLAWLDCRAAELHDHPHRFFLDVARVGMNDGAAFGQGGEGFVRLNFACPRSMLGEALERMRAALAGL